MAIENIMRIPRFVDLFLESCSGNRRIEYSRRSDFALVAFASRIWEWAEWLFTEILSQLLGSASEVIFN